MALRRPGGVVALEEHVGRLAAGAPARRYGKPQAASVVAARRHHQGGAGAGFLVALGVVRRQGARFRLEAHRGALVAHAGGHFGAGAALLVAAVETRRQFHERRQGGPAAGAGKAHAAHHWRAVGGVGELHAETHSLHRHGQLVDGLRAAAGFQRQRAGVRPHGDVEAARVADDAAGADQAHAHGKVRGRGVVLRAIAAHGRLAAADSDDHPRLGLLGKRPAHIRVEGGQRGFQVALAGSVRVVVFVAGVGADASHRAAGHPARPASVHADVHGGEAAVVGVVAGFAGERGEVAAAPKRPGAAASAAAEQRHLERGAAPHLFVARCQTASQMAQWRVRAVRVAGMRQRARRAGGQATRPRTGTEPRRGRPVTVPDVAVRRARGLEGGCLRPILRIEPPSAHQQRHAALPWAERQAAADGVRGAGEHAAAHRRERLFQHRDFRRRGGYDHRDVQHDLGGGLRGDGNDRGAFRHRRDGQPVPRNPRHGDVGVAARRRVVEARIRHHVRQVELRRRAADHQPHRRELHRHAGVHLVRRLIGERDGAPHRVAGQVGHRAAGERVAFHGYAVGVDVAVGDGVAEGEGALVFVAAHESRGALCAADGEG